MLLVLDWQKSLKEVQAYADSKMNGKDFYEKLEAVKILFDVKAMYNTDGIDGYLRILDQNRAILKSDPYSKQLDLWHMLLCKEDNIMTEEYKDIATEENSISGGSYDGKKYVASSNYIKSIDVLTASSICFNGIEFKAVWETEGLKIPLVVNNGDGNKPFYLRIPRDEVVKMFVDILDQLSHK